MAVQGPGNIPERIRALQPLKADIRPQKAPAPAPAPTDRVTISPQAREVRNLARQVEATPEVRPNAVADAKARAANVPPAKVAEKLLLEN